MDELLSQASNGALLAQAALNFQMGADQALPRNLAAVPPATPIVGELEDWTSAAPGYFPEIAVLGNYGLYDDKLFGANGHNGSVMAVARINLLGGGSNSAARAAARHETASFESDIKRFEEGVRLEAQQAWQDLETARIRHKTAKSALAAATEAARVRASRFKQGLDKMIDLLDAETGLREAEMRELVARYDVVLDTHRLRYVAGASLISTEDSQ
jgi:outer membrane protein TolC